MRLNLGETFRTLGALGGSLRHTPRRLFGLHDVRVSFFPANDGDVVLDLLGVFELIVSFRLGGSHSVISYLWLSVTWRRPRPSANLKSTFG